MNPAPVLLICIMFDLCHIIELTNTITLSSSFFFARSSSQVFLPEVVRRYFLHALLAKRLDKSLQMNSFCELLILMKLSRPYTKKNYTTRSLSYACICVLFLKLIGRYTYHLLISSGLIQHSIEPLPLLACLHAFRVPDAEQIRVESHYPQLTLFLFYRVVATC